MPPTLDCPGDVGDNSAQDPFSEELQLQEPDSPERDMTTSAASPSTTSNTYGEAPPWAASLKGLDGLTQQADNNTLRIVEEIGGRRKETAELSSKMTGLTESIGRHGGNGGEPLH